ncbi:hypothetical protein BDN70DRAFT_872335 [Pholiota conissans]|uniref:F-box domain-containing protein n=1 Tax=Pholiota conissans TaxID=109636 RepID=A0A9P6D643_9AGAR|nr:hypothetical protein BDN70DRAFT_872335 [Pholiota conissans]
MPSESLLPKPHTLGISEEKAHQISRIDTEVGRTRDDITTLLRKCADLNRKRNSFLLPVNLPTELLTIIFEFSCSPVDEKPPFSTIIGRDFWQISYQPMDSCSVVPGPLHLSRVCSRWREASLNTPQLWDNIQLIVTRRHAKKQAALLRYWLASAGQRPLTVSLVQGNNAEDDSDMTTYDIPTAVIDALLPYSNQLFILDLFMTTSWESAFVQLGKNVPILTSLTISPAFASEDDPLEEIYFFALAPQLENVTLSSYSIPAVALPLVQIKSFITDNMDEEAPYEIFRICPNLLHFKLDIRLDAPEWTVFTDSQRHDKLETLELLVQTDEDVSVLLDRLTLPALRSFTLEVTDESPVMMLIQPFLARSACALAILNLHCFTMPEDELISCLKSLPMLRALKLVNSRQMGRIYQNVLDSMNPRKQQISEKNNECLVPHLESFCYSGKFSPSLHALVEFAVDRWDNCDVDLPDDHRPPSGTNMPVVRLRSLTFMTDWKRLESNPGIVGVLRRLRKEGMKVEIVDEFGFCPGGPPLSRTLIKKLGLSEAEIEAMSMIR